MIKKSNNSQKKAYLFALLAVLFWSTMSSAFKITLRFISFDELLFWSALTGMILLGIYKLFVRGFEKTDFNAKALMSSAVMGAFNPFLYYLVLFKAYSLLEAQVAVSLNYVWPIVLVLFSILFLKQKISLKAIISLFVSFMGIVIIITGGNMKSLHIDSFTGVLLALFSAVFWASYWILNMKDKRDDISKIWLNLFFGLLYIFLYLLFTRKTFLFPDVRGFIGSVYIGIFEMSLTFVIWLKALNNSSDTAKVSNIIFLSPFIALFWINNAVGETIRLSTFAGLFFIVAGIVMQQYFGHTELKKTKRNAD